MSYELVLPFDTDDPEFIRGFEVGMVWAALQAGSATSFTVHHSNAEMMLRIGETNSMKVQAEPVDDGYMDVTFIFGESV